MVWGEEERRAVPFSSHHVRATYVVYLPLMVLTLISWPGECLPGSSTAELLLSPLPYSYYLDTSHKVQPILNEGVGGIKLHFLEWGISLHTLFEIVL